MYLFEKEIACILYSEIIPNVLSKKNKESNHVSIITLSENNGDGSICVPENMPTPIERKAHIACCIRKPR